jgi:hypothetical protein
VGSSVGKRNSAYTPLPKHPPVSEGHQTFVKEVTDASIIDKSNNNTAQTAVAAIPPGKKKDYRKGWVCCNCERMNTTERTSHSLCGFLDCFAVQCALHSITYRQGRSRNPDPCHKACHWCKDVFIIGPVEPSDAGRALPTTAWACHLCFRYRDRAPVAGTICGCRLPTNLPDLPHRQSSLWCGRCLDVVDA